MNPIYFGLLCIILTGCTTRTWCETSKDCKADEFCFDDGGWDGGKHCMPYYPFIYINLTEKNETDGIASRENDIYCTPDWNASIHCNCDTLVFPDGHNETVNCKCYDDLVMHYRCRNLTEENITLIRGGE
jgi:hypothetical protein